MNIMLKACLIIFLILASYYLYLLINDANENGFDHVQTIYINADRYNPDAGNA